MTHEVTTALTAINLEAPVVVQCHTVVLASQAAVWRVLTDFGRWPQWLPEVSRAELLDPLGPGARVRVETCGLVTVAKLTTVVPQEYLGWIEGSTGIRAVQAWRLRTVHGAVLVTAEESWEGQMVSDYPGTLTRGLRACVTDWLSRLKRRSERQDLGDPHHHAQAAGGLLTVRD